MALQEGVRSMSLPAAEDLSASQFCFMNIDAAGRIALPSANGDAVGVLQDKPDAIDRAGEVGMLEASLRLKVIAAGTITAGNKIKTDAAGKALVATTGTHVLATALKSAVAGDLVEITPGARHILA